jgi:hypothetical protein
MLEREKRSLDLAEVVKGPSNLISFQSERNDLNQPT